MGSRAEPPGIEEFYLSGEVFGLDQGWFQWRWHVRGLPSVPRDAGMQRAQGAQYPLLEENPSNDIGIPN